MQELSNIFRGSAKHSLFLQVLNPPLWFLIESVQSRPGQNELTLLPMYRALPVKSKKIQ